MIFNANELNIINKSITRKDAKAIHKDLPPGGEWKTVNHHHIYVLNGKVLAGAVEGAKGAKKATKAQLADHQVNIDKEAKAANKTAPKTIVAKLPEKSNTNFKLHTKADLIASIRKFSSHIMNNLDDKDKTAFVSHLSKASGKPVTAQVLKYIENRSKASDNALNTLPKNVLLVQATDLQQSYNHLIDYQKSKKEGQDAKKTIAKKATTTKTNKTTEPKAPAKKTPTKPTAKDIASKKLEALKPEYDRLKRDKREYSTLPKGKKRTALLHSVDVAMEELNKKQEAIFAEEYKAKGKESTTKARKDINAIADSRPKEPKKKEVLPKDNKKNVEAVLSGANNKSTKLKPKVTTKADVDKMVKDSERQKQKRTPKPATKEDLDKMFGASTSTKKTVNQSKIAAAKTNQSKAEKPVAAKPKKDVADIRTEKQDNHDIAYDVGNKIGGARKDIAALKAATEKLMSDSTGQSLDNLEAMSPEVAQKYCVKKNLINPVDFEADYKNGVDIKTAMCKQLIYDRIVPKPVGDTAEDRQKYLNAIRNLQRVLEPIKNWDEFRKAVSDLGSRMKRETPSYLKEQESYLEYAKKKLAEGPRGSDLLETNYKTGKYEHITPEEWQTKQQKRIEDINEHMKQHATAAAEPFAPLGEKLTNFFTNYESRNRTYDTMNKKKLDWANYFKQAEEATNKPKEKKESGNTIKWERQMPAKVQRSGGRKTPVSKPEDMIKTFKFKGVEFGNYVDDKSGNFHLIKCAEAFQDLADIIGFKDKDVSLNGSLSMAFGARGKGMALAHYEPMAKAINITKNGGAGTLCHEWGHALDNLMYQESAGHNSLNYASEGMADHGSPEVKAAYKDVMHNILFGDGNGKDTVENKHKTYYSFHPSFKKAVEEFGLGGAIKRATDMINEKAAHSNEYYEKLRGRYDDKTIDRKILSAERKRKMDINDMVQEMAYHHEKLTGEKLDQIPVYSGHSQYYVDSSKQGGKDNKYWTSKCEMFARAFENYVEGKMKTGPIKNDYLVSGTYTKGFDAAPAPYPQGAEREAIHKSFDKLIAAIRNSGAIQKALEIMELQKGNLCQELDQSNRNAYNVPSTEGVIWIPLNRLQCPYQTEGALNFDKIKENVEKMKSGDFLDPIIIGFNYDVHDGHHRLEASKIMKYTHVPCVVGGANEINKQRAEEDYREIWKSIKK